MHSNRVHQQQTGPSKCNITMTYAQQWSLSCIQAISMDLQTYPQTVHNFTVIKLTASVLQTCPCARRITGECSYLYTCVKKNYAAKRRVEKLS